MFILIRLTQHVSGIIMPIVRRRDYVNKCMWSMTGCVDCSRAELGNELCALCESWYMPFTQCTQLVSQLHMQLFIQSVLLTMGIMMPKTCSVNLMRINIYICGIYLVLSYPAIQRV